MVYIYYNTYTIYYIICYYTIKLFLLEIFSLFSIKYQLLVELILTKKLDVLLFLKFWI